MKKILTVLSTVLFLIILSAGFAFAAEFSADTVMTHKKGVTTAKIYSKTEKFRTEMKSPEEVIVITRIDKKVIWNIMPKQKMYMEMPLKMNMRNKPRVEEKFEGETDRKHVGNETVDGHPAKKYLITYKLNNKQEQVYQWWATDINFPVKNAAVDGSWVQEFKNIKMGSQPDSLFEVPSGYQKMQIPGGMNFRDK